MQDIWLIGGAVKDFGIYRDITYHAERRFLGIFVTRKVLQISRCIIPVSCIMGIRLQTSIMDTYSSFDGLETERVFLYEITNT